MSSQPMSSNEAPEHRNLNKKAVALFSGGLDSSLAIHLVMQQGIDVTALHFTSFFSPSGVSDDRSPVVVVARQLGVNLVFRSRGDDFLTVIRNPRHGYGKNLNPCIDCRIYTFIKAKEMLEEIGASFIVTGEVVGQRPMSQRKNTIRMIEKRAGCDGIVLRPLSAKLLPPTIVEEAGMVDREPLLDIAGRGRKTQLRLAEEIGLQGYAPPAGGCLLTDRSYSGRLRDLFEDEKEVSHEELQLLKTGRHLRLRPGLKIVVSRREEENLRLKEMTAAGTIYFPIDFPGPLVMVHGKAEPQEEILIASVLRRYSKKDARKEWIGIMEPESGERRIQVTDVADDQWIQDHMI